MVVMMFKGKARSVEGLYVWQVIWRILQHAMTTRHGKAWYGMA